MTIQEIDNICSMTVVILCLIATTLWWLRGILQGSKGDSNVEEVGEGHEMGNSDHALHHVVRGDTPDPPLQYIPAMGKALLPHPLPHTHHRPVPGVETQPIQE